MLLPPRKEAQPMANYLLVETRDPFDSSDVEDLYNLAEGLADEANDVAIFLVQNGVLPVRKASAAGPRLAGMAAKATVLADDFSLRERGIRADEMAEGVQTAPIEPAGRSGGR
jgi:sulfur relay (sulfurtransferase) complex TusBCD TusD component (DsrE family)